MTPSSFSVVAILSVLSTESELNTPSVVKIMNFCESARLLWNWSWAAFNPGYGLVAWSSCGIWQAPFSKQHESGSAGHDDAPCGQPSDVAVHPFTVSAIIDDKLSQYRKFALSSTGEPFGSTHRYGLLSPQANSPFGSHVLWQQSPPSKEHDGVLYAKAFESQYPSPMYSGNPPSEEMYAAQSSMPSSTSSP